MSADVNMVPMVLFFALLGIFCAFHMFRVGVHEVQYSGVGVLWLVLGTVVLLSGVFVILLTVFVHWV